MATKVTEPAPKHPSITIFIAMMSGPKVDVYVGAEKKHYNLPKLLLCHYSKYFDRCFNGSFIETRAQRLDLPEDKVKYFDVLLEYMLRGKLLNPPSMGEPDENNSKSIAKECMAFLEYADRYNLREVGDVMYRPLKASLLLLVKHKRNGWGGQIVVEAQYIETVFGTTSPASSLRGLIAQLVLSECGMGGIGAFVFEQQEQIPGFATEFLRQIRGICLDQKPEWK